MLPLLNTKSFVRIIMKKLPDSAALLMITEP